MKLSKLFMMALLAGTLGVFGCSDDNGGTGGTGGSTADPCTGGLCDTDSAAKTNCQAAIAACNSSVDVELTPTECDALGRDVFCTEGGTGGTGGDGGGGTGGDGGGGTGGDGGGGTGGDGGGGTGGTPSFAACDEDLCKTEPDRKALCEEFIPACLIHCETEVCGEDECILIAGIFICNEQES